MLWFGTSTLLLFVVSLVCVIAGAFFDGFGCFGMVVRSSDVVDLAAGVFLFGVSGMSCFRTSTLLLLDVSLVCVIVDAFFDGLGGFPMVVWWFE